MMTPTLSTEAFAALGAPHRLQQTRVQRDGSSRRQMQRAALAAQAAEVGRVLGVTAYAGDLVAIALDDDAAADTAIGAGGLGFAHDALVVQQSDRMRGPAIGALMSSWTEPTRTLSPAPI